MKRIQLFRKFDLLAQEYENSKALLIAARRQEMESILPGFYTVCMGQKIKSPDYMERSMFNIAGQPQ